MVEQISKDKNIVVVCNHGVFRSRYLCDLIRRKGYINVDYGGVASWRGRRATLDMLGSAEVIISVNPDITTLLETKYQPKSHQRVVQLNVPDILENRGIGEVRRDLEKQIQAYLSE